MKLHLATALLAISLTSSVTASESNRPWDDAGAILVIDPYEGNSIDWDKLATDKSVKGFMHRAFHGFTPDSAYKTRIAEARKRGLEVGIYLLGKPGDPIKQADLLIDAANALKVGLVALDIENTNPKDAMTLDNAKKFIAHVKEKTGRYPMFYTNFSTYSVASKKFKNDPDFANSPLWLARFAPRHGMNDFNIWKNYTLWQFQSEINCNAGKKCFHPVAGTKPDMDVNVFRGNADEFQKLFNPK